MGEKAWQQRWARARVTCSWAWGAAGVGPHAPRERLRSPGQQQLAPTTEREKMGHRTKKGSLSLGTAGQRTQMRLRSETSLPAALPVWGSLEPLDAGV